MKQTGMELLRAVGYSCKSIQKIELCLVCALLLTIDCTSVTDVASSQFGTFDFAELDEVLYDLEFSTQPVSEQDMEITSGDNHVTLVSRHGQKYVCSVPTVSERGDSAREFESPNVSALLLPLHKKPCLTKTIGWWTYEYCHGQFVRQYHVEAGKVMGNTVWLGTFHRETEWNRTHVDKVKKLISSVKNNIKKGYAMANHMTYYTNGTKCDLTGHPRTAVAKLYCGLGSRNKLVEVQESEMCNYTLSIETPLLCTHPMFDPLYGNDPHLVTCSPVLSQQAYEEHMMKQELLRHEKEKREQERQQKEAAAKEESTTTQAGLSSSEQQLLTSFFVKSLSNLLGSSTDMKDFDLGSEFSDEDYLGELEAKADSQFQDAKSTEMVKESSWSKGSDQVGRSEGERDVGMDDDKMNTEGDDGDQSMRTTSTSTHKSSVNSREVEGEESDKDVNFETVVTRLFSHLLDEMEAKDPKRTVPLHTIPKSISDKFSTEEERRGEMPGSLQSREQLLEEEEQRTQQENSKVSAGDGTDSSLQTELRTSVDKDLKKTVLSKQQGEGDSGTQWKKFLSLLLRKSDREDYQDSESEKAVESELGDFIGELDEKSLDNLAEELAEELSDEELGEVLEQLDGEMLREVEEEVAENLQERFNKAGIKGPEVRVKILPMRGNNLLHDLLTEDDSEEEEEGETDSTKDYSDGDSSDVRAKAVKKRSGDFSALAESVSKLVDELFMDSNDVPMSEERKKQQKLESSYEQVWGDAQQKQKDKKPSR